MIKAITIAATRISNYKDDKLSFPCSVKRDEINGRFHLMTHPSNQEVTLQLPPFYIDPSVIFGIDENCCAGRLMTKQIAQMIGSRISSSDAGSMNDLHSETIFVGVVNYRNIHCPYTIESIFQQAKYPERIRVGVVDQFDPQSDSYTCGDAASPCRDNPNQALCRYSDQIDVYEMEALYAVGDVFARHIIHRLYRGEYYFMLLDVKSHLSSHWDVDIISQFDSLDNEMAVLSSFLENAPTDGIGTATLLEDNNGAKLHYFRGEVGTPAEGMDHDVSEQGATSPQPTLCDAHFVGKNRKGKRLTILSHQPDWIPPLAGKTPLLQPYWSSDFSFSRGHFVINVPYDPYLPMVLDDGEDVSMTLRGFTHGYDFFSPKNSISSRRQGDGELGNYHDNDNLYGSSSRAALNRLFGIVQLNPEIPLSAW
eukprot:CAMPEP_0194398182 /NCGR_PEP_ID=MMETSP0174-20130528/125962_1 /TAXON_ID=216777 /ORGANISM="Proboscia alata, Strain PI-D3" /LENGTH=422 /DNA_ID=CAMNT_0039194451 /DNA_START=762 /DNA_END=2027 /DNA_ORIENTATION=-